jgi:endonuclease/exonuclease/phosphatase family metal-dependent hydrolase
MPPVRKFTLLLFALPLALCAGERQLSVVTLNMAKESSVSRVAGELGSIPELRHADVFLLQEVARFGGRPISVAEVLATALKMDAVGSKEAPDSPGLGLAILSRYPLRDVSVRPLKRYELVFHTRSRYVLSAIADTPWGPVRIVNTHLDTRLNASDRLAQLDGAVRDSGSGAAIVGGDFNSNWFYWLHHVVPVPALSQTRWVETFMSRAGYRSALPALTTFDYLGQRLDWIWLRGLKSTASGVYPLKFSDHHACWTRIEF